MSITVGINGVTFPDGSSQITATKYGMKNRIINGAMVIDQRNAGASSSAVNGAYYLDRWLVTSYDGSAQTGKFTVQQNAGAVTPPTGFTNYLGITSSAATSLGSSAQYLISQRIEGFNVADLGWGSASAKPITISFQVYSSLTGTFGGSLQNSANNRSYPFSYTVSSANTWTPISITIAGDTTGTWLTTNGVGINVTFSLGSGTTVSGTAGSWSGSYYWSATGATSVVGTNGATFYITGVQLEVGSSATGFEYRQYGQELALCQRYYEKSYDVGVVPATVDNQGYVLSPTGSNTVPSQATFFASFKTTKRAQPTMTIYGYKGATGVVSNGSSGADLGANSGTLNSSSTNMFSLLNNTGGSLSTGLYAVIFHFTASAEL